MLDIKENIPLALHTSFRIGGPARYYAEITTVDDIRQALEFSHEHNLPYLLLGGGSNMLISDAGYPGLVMHIVPKGMKVIKSGASQVELKVGAGEVWDDVVAFAVLHNLWGIENLSYIPGLAGGLPVQNVGAYGQEASQVINEIFAFDTLSGKAVTISRAECGFSYRQSIFNTTEKNRYIILNITLSLSSKPRPNLGYKDVAQRLDPGVVDLNVIRQTIIDIRDKKLPHPKDIGSAGSFFKNLELSAVDYKIFEKKVAERFSQEILKALRAIARPAGGNIKVPTAFVIDKLLGYKGASVGEARIYQEQALVIINHSGRAKAKDVLELFKKIRIKAKTEFDIEIKPEPNLIGFSEQELEYYFAFN
jgi:UDP-N-acetylmuramate dehydrogenase